MVSQVFCRVGERVRATDLDGACDTVGSLKARILGETIRALPGASDVVLTRRGRWLADESASLADAGVRANDTLAIAIRLRGGGGDGGATGAESRSCYLEMYADNGGTGFSRKKESLGGFIKYTTQSTVRDRDEREEDLARWFNCTLTEEPLETGDGAVVIDRLGSLFNREGVLKALRDKCVDGVALPQRLEHITGMKAITALRLHKNERTKISVKDASGKVNATSFRLAAEAVFSCPITGLDFNGKTKFVALVPSGLVVSDRALREAKSAVEDILGPDVKLDEQTRVTVNPKGEELDAMRESLEEEAAKKAAKKKKKDSKKNGAGAGTVTGAEDQTVELVAGTGIKSNGKREWNGCDDLSNEQLKAQAKRWRACDNVPEGADKDVYASLFTGTTAHEREQETYLSRNARKAW